jgi:cytochrome c peroxidase
VSAVRAVASALACALACAACTSHAPPPEPRAPKTWSDTERSVLATLRLSALRPPPPDPGNAHGDDPRAATLGAELFTDPGLSLNGRISCETCHLPGRAFSDGRARSVGLAPLRRNAPTLFDVAYQRWLFWDGRADSLWSQTLWPLEQRDEMGGSRTAIVYRIAGDPRLARMYTDVFGALPEVRWEDVRATAGPNGDDAARAAWAALPEPDRTSITRAFANLGKALAAYERTLRSRPSRFDAYVDAVLENRTNDAERALDAREERGLALFLSGRSGCLSCHHGPLFSDGQFHNIGTGDLGTPDEDPGRAAGREQLRTSEFSCTSPFRDGAPTDCGHLTAMRSTEIGDLMRGAFRTPGLRNLPATAPYLHDGRFATLEDVLAFYRKPPDKTKVRHELPPLDLSDGEITDLARFLRALAPAG